MFVDGLQMAVSPLDPNENATACMTTPCGKWVFDLLFSSCLCSRLCVCVWLACLPAPLWHREAPSQRTHRGTGLQGREKNMSSEERSNKSQLSRHCPHSPPLCPRRLCAAPVLRLRLKAAVLCWAAMGGAAMSPSPLVVWLCYVRCLGLLDAVDGDEQGRERPVERGVCKAAPHFRV